MDSPGIFTIIWNFIKQLWGWHLNRRQKEEDAVQERARELAEDQKAAQMELDEQEKAIDQRAQEQQVNTDPDAVVADLNDIFRRVCPHEPDDQQG